MKPQNRKTPNVECKRDINLFSQYSIERCNFGFTYSLKMNIKPKETELNNFYSELEGRIKQVKIVHILIICFLLLIFSCLIFTLKTTDLDFNKPIDPSIWSQFGDFVGGVIGTLIGGITLILVYRTFVLQKEELRETRKILSQQQIDKTFFDLIGVQHEITNSIFIKFSRLKTLISFSNQECSGREFFRVSKQELKRIILSLKYDKFLLYNYETYQAINEETQGNEAEYDFQFQEAGIGDTNEIYNISKEIWENCKGKNELEIAKSAYSIFFKRYHFVIGHYFRHLYHILKFLKKHEDDAIKQCSSQIEIDEIIKQHQSYADFLQAQMSAPELFLLYYNCLAFPKSEDLVVKYNILENLPVEALIDKKHWMQYIKLRRIDDLLQLDYTYVGDE